MLSLTSEPIVAQATNPGPLAELSGSIRHLTRHVVPAVVEIVVTGYGATENTKGLVANQVAMQQTTGSGVVVDSAGFIMTNAHVVQGAIGVKILLTGEHSEGPTARPARIVGIDRDSDLALLHITNDHLPALEFGDSGLVRQGDLVFAVGSPAGLRNSLSMGVVSAPARAVNDDDPILYIQTDAPINPGNSGGALVDTHGSLIGLNSFIVSQSGGNEGIGFAIPSNVVRDVYLQLRQNGRVSKGDVGLFVQTNTPTLAAGLDLPTTGGVVVADVSPESPAERAGVKRRDVVVRLNGVQLATARDFDRAVYRGKAGDILRLAILRSGSHLAILVKVESKPEPVDSLLSLVSPEYNLVRRLGILCVEIDKEVAAAFPDLRRRYGLIIAGRTPASLNTPLDLQENDVIHAINNQIVTDLALFRQTVDNLKAGAPVVIQVERNHRLQFIAFEAP